MTIMMKLRLTKLRKTYPGGHEAVREIDLDVDDGQMMVLLGPSGCGKTTLLRLICGLETPDSGTIILNDMDITEWEPRKRDVAMVFQNYALYPHMTVRENLEFGLKSRKIPKGEREEAVKWASEMLGLSKMIDRKPKELSGGQRQRVALGRAIVRKPQIYLYDEPLSNLDAELRMMMRGEILRLHRRVGGTSIYVTHDQVEAMSLADQICLMKDGEIVSSGPPSELYNNPPDLFTAGFLGFPAMNLIPGKLENGVFMSERGMAIRSIAGQGANAGAVILGIRPEDLEIINKGDIICEVISLENLGRNFLYYTRSAGGDEFRLVSDREFGIGKSIALKVNSEKIYLFDSIRKSRLTH